MNDLHLKLLSLFQGECRDHLSAVRAALDVLEASNWDRADTNFTEMHRRVHSLKGAARAVDLKQIEGLAHSLETLVERIDRQALRLDAETVRAFRDALDAIEDHAQSVERGAPVDIPGNVKASIEELLMPGAGGKGKDAPVDASGASGPDPEPIAEAAAASSAGQKEDGKQPRTRSPSAKPAESIRVDIDVLDGLLSWSGDFLTLTSAQDRLVDRFKELEHGLAAARQLLAQWGGVGKEQDQPDANARATLDIALAAKHLDAELRNIAAHAQGLKRVQMDLGWRARSMARRLDTHVRRARMVQIESVIGNIRKIVRDIAQEQGKAVHVETRGLDLVADRWVMQALKDPVIHLLRNCVSHGAEGAEERKAAGKPVETAVRVIFDQEGDMLSVTVEDDGRGIDANRVAARARELGLGDVDVADAQAVADILTTDRFTTASEINEVAGRGLGLSIVREAVSRLGGELEIDSVAGKGACFRLRVPISVSSQPLLVVSAGGETCAIPARNADRVLRFDLNALQSVEGRDVLVLGEDVPLQVMTLAGLLGREAPALSGDGGMAVAVSLKTTAGRGGVIVDKVIGVRDGLIRDLGQAAAGVELVSGGVVLDDGTVAPVLNAARLVDGVLSRTAGVRIDRKSRKPRMSRILVVDDSITTRTLEKSILEANGYEVRLSVDGVDALELLRKEKIDLIVSDLEMPRMDGFDLVRAIKNDRDLSGIPVVMVTSRNNEEDRRRGLRLGAEAYVVKQSFNQTSLLETIEQLL